LKRFHFGLERVRQWREKQVTIEEIQLERLFSERKLIEQRLALLEREAQESAALVMAQRALEVYELHAVDAFRRYVVAERAVIAARIADCDRRIAAQQQKLVEARRKSELLNKLKERRWNHWNTELSKEIEAQAGEMFLAKWGKTSL
jgi:flagellar export protein FliJ